MDYFFYLYISDKYLQFRGKKYINLSNQIHYKKYNQKGRNISQTFVFFFHHSISHEASGYTFCNVTKKKHLLRNIFGSSHTPDQIYFMQNSFSNYLYLKSMYITLKGIGKILFISVLRILLICKFLRFTPPSLKKIKLSKVCINLSE